MAKEIIISERENLASTFENGKIVDFFMNEGEQLVGDIILGKVDSVVQSIDASFVSIGKNRNGFIHVTDLAISKNPRRKTGIKNHLRPKQNLLVQIAKEATGSKGPRLTCMLSIPGKYMVLTPFERKIGISKKITDTVERERLIFIAKKICQAGYGLIVRTEATGQSEEALKEDLEYLLKRWHEILKMSETAQAPAVLYRDQDLLYRVLRDSLTSDVEKIIVDTLETKNRAVELLQSWSNDAFRFVTLNKNPVPLALQYNLFTELEKAIQPKVSLPSGGYLIIEHTEALTVIDVNSGNTRGTNNLNETILQTNKEAAVEIGRQIRLRDIGGVIVIDFIDMIDQREQQIVWQILANSVKNDKAQPQLGYFSEFSLLEITRHRQRKSLEQMLTNKCPYCDGIGRIRNNVYRADLLSPESIKNRIPVPESMKRPGDETFRIKTEDFTANVDYVENKMDRIPPEIAKIRNDSHSSSREFSYLKNDKTPHDYETVESEAEKDEALDEVVKEVPVEETYYKKSRSDKKRKHSFSDEEKQYIESIDSYEDYEDADISVFESEEKVSEFDQENIIESEHVSDYPEISETDSHRQVPFENEAGSQETFDTLSEAVKPEISEQSVAEIPSIEYDKPEEAKDIHQEFPHKKQSFKKGSRGRKPFKKKSETVEQLSIPESVPVTEPSPPQPQSFEDLIASVDIDSPPEPQTEQKKKLKQRRIRSFSPKKRK